MQKVCTRHKNMILDTVDLLAKSELGLKFSGPGKMGVAFNIVCTMDLTNVLESRNCPGNLHYIYLPDAPDWAWTVVLRMVKPWKEWIMITFPKPGFENASEMGLPHDEYVKLARKITGLPELPVQINGVYKWYVNGEMADGVGKGRVLCLGDAVHRHPPLVSPCPHFNFNSAG